MTQKKQVRRCFGSFRGSLMISRMVGVGSAFCLRLVFPRRPDIFDILGSTAAVIVFGTEAAFFDKAEKSVYNVGSQLSAGSVFDDRNRFFKVHAVAVGTVGVHSVETVRNSDDLSDLWNLVAFETSNVP